MTIPKNITFNYILQAIAFIDKSRVPERRQSVDYDLIFEQKRYPLKYVISKANFFANGFDLEASEFSGGEETNNFLINLGFEIESHNVIESYSWTVLNNQVAIKKLDKSAFHHNGTGIPVDIRSFFNIDGLTKGESKSSILIFNGKMYQGVFRSKRDSAPNARTQLHWHSDFASVLQSELPKWYDLFRNDSAEIDNTPELRFSRTEKDNEYLISILDFENLANDIENEQFENLEFSPQKEGKIQYFYGIRYERNLNNRKMAIETHGLKCAVCGFDFFQAYGEQGKGFIEVHHIKPLCTFQNEDVVNPETDLLPVCSNCHRMIHRNPQQILSIDGLRQLIITNRNPIPGKEHRK